MLNQRFDKATACSENFKRALMLNAVSQCHSTGTKATVAAAWYSDVAADWNIARCLSDASIRGARARGRKVSAAYWQPSLWR